MATEDVIGISSNQSHAEACDIQSIGRTVTKEDHSLFRKDWLLLWLAWIDQFNHSTKKAIAGQFHEGRLIVSQLEDEERRSGEDEDEVGMPPGAHNNNNQPPINQ